MTHRQKIGVADNDGEQIIEIVGDAAGKLADGLHLLRLYQLFLGALALGQIVDDADEDGSPSRFASPTESSIGNREPSLRRPLTSRPVPMIFAAPVWR